MIIVVANAIVKDGTQEQFIKVAEKCVKETSKEAGNISYCLTKDCFNHNKFTFVEEWETNEALEAHMKTQHFQRLGADIKDILAEELSICVSETKN